jgi:hypothetical protein
MQTKNEVQNAVTVYYTTTTTRKREHSDSHFEASEQ